MGELILDVMLSKTDGELFKELMRLYPLADVEDYYKMGQWQHDLMRMDIQVFYAHREEAGAPELPPLEEIEMPPLPVVPAAMLQMQQMMAMQQAMAKGEVPAGAVASTLQVNAAAQAALPAAELQLIVNFANKHKLDLVKTKTTLSTLSAVTRTAVMTGFESSGEDEAEKVKQLEAFIAEKKKLEPATNGATAPAGLTSPAAATALAAANAAKRPLMPTAMDPNKRPHMMMPQPGARPMMPGFVGGARPQWNQQAMGQYW